MLGVLLDTVGLMLAVAGFVVLCRGKMMIAGGRMVRGDPARWIGGAAFLLFPVSFKFQESLPVNPMLIFVAVFLAVYFFYPGEAPTEEEAQYAMFGSRQEEVNEWKTLGKSLLKASLILFGLVAGVSVLFYLLGQLF